MLTTPWALLALISVPIVFGIYFFRTRSRRREVSSLFLWVDRSQAKQGGRRIQRLQLPLIILLELLALILLAVAAARPMIRSETMGRPTAIILDTSYSMSAGEGEDTVRKRAVDDLHRMLDTQIGYPVQFVLAGPKPLLVSGRARNSTEAREVLKNWTCDAPSSNLDAAVSLVANITTTGTKILVVTDHAPEGDVSEGKMLWKSYGKPSDNFAIVHANRVFHDDRDRVLLEVVNFSENAKPLQLSIVEPDRNAVVFRDQQTIGALEIYRRRIGVKSGTGPIEVRLADDSLQTDNRLPLLPPSRKPIRVKVGSLPTDVAEKVRRAIEASGIGVLVQDNPEIQFDSAVDVSNQPASLWTVRIVAETDSDKVKSFIGPYLIEHTHPIATGLSLDGVVWSGAEEPNWTGTPIISAGEVPLLVEQRRRNGSRVLSMQLNDRLSTLTSGPAWPILIWNILRYRGGQTVGFAINNMKLGTEAEFVPAEGDRALDVFSPDGEKKTVPIVGGPVRVPADRVGVYRTKTESGEYSFSVGTLSAKESNLLETTTGIYGNWLDDETLRTEYRSVVWVLLLATLALLTIHHRVVSVKKSELVDATK